MCIVTEIVTMKTVDGITKEKFIDIVNELERNYHSNQPGFIDTELLFDDSKGDWIIIQHWDSMENLKSASKKMFQDTAASSFVQSLDPKSVKMTVLPQLRKW